MGLPGFLSKTALRLDRHTGGHLGAELRLPRSQLLRCRALKLVACIRSQQAIAQSRNAIDQARLLCEKAAWTIDQHGNKAAHLLVSQIKAVAPQVACDVIDRAIQVHGAAGVSEDTALARLYAWHRAMRIFDGPDEVHMRSIAGAEIGREQSAFAAAVT